MKNLSLPSLKLHLPHLHNSPFNCIIFRVILHNNVSKTLYWSVNIFKIKRETPSIQLFLPCQLEYLLSAGQDKKKKKTTITNIHLLNCCWFILTVFWLASYQLVLGGKGGSLLVWRAELSHQGPTYTRTTKVNTQYGYTGRRIQSPQFLQQWYITLIQLPDKTLY